MSPPLLALVLAVHTAAAAEPVSANRPNLPLDAGEINRIEQEVKDHDWAARLFGRVRALADEPGHSPSRPETIRDSPAVRNDRLLRWMLFDYAYANRPRAGGTPPVTP